MRQRLGNTSLILAVFPQNALYGVMVASLMIAVRFLKTWSRLAGCFKGISV
jgi:hypothetical protein